MAYYENLFIVRPDLSVKEVDEIEKKYSDIIQTHKGKVKRVENWGLKNFTYKIKKNSKGYYVLFYLDAPDEAIKECSRQMFIDENIVRHLIVKVDELSNEPSYQMEKAKKEMKNTDEMNNKDQANGK